MRRSNAVMAVVRAAATLGIAACAEIPGGVTAGAPNPAVVVPPEDRDVRVAQVALQAAGYNPGPGKGILNGQTQEALVAFRRDHGLPAAPFISGGIAAYCPPILEANQFAAPRTLPQALLMSASADAGPRPSGRRVA